MRRRLLAAMVAATLAGLLIPLLALTGLGA